MKTLFSVVLIFAFSSPLFAQPVDDLPTRGAIKLWPNENTDNKTPRHFKTPTKKLAERDYPFFRDDIDFVRMEVAISRQLAHYKKFPVSGTIKFGKTSYPLKHVTKTLQSFLELSEQARACIEESADKDEKADCYQAFHLAIVENFDVFAPHLTKDDPRHDEEEQTFFTAYYTPTLEASRSRIGDFRHGIYAKPRNATDRKSTRVQIHFEDRLERKDLTLFYVKDLFDLYLLHVQGGGRIVYEENGELRQKYIHYDGTNRQPFRWISVYMRDKGYITDGKIESQRGYLLAHPEKEREIYNYCPSYIYYKESDEQATGSGGVSVTNGRSIATDWRHYRYKGLLSFVVAKRPTEDSTPTEVEYKPFSRFMLDQDTGGAIKGKARVDLFHGEDKYAEIAAFNTKHTGNLFYLMLKKNR